MSAAPPFVGPPVHTPRLGGKLPERVINAAAQPPADFLSPSKPPLVWRLQPALIAQPVAVATGEHAPDDVQPENPAGAVPTLEPQPLSAKPARRPGGGNMLLAAPAVRRYGVGRLPGRRWLKVALPAQVQCVDEPATLNAVFASACTARHLSLHFSSPNNRNRLANPALSLEGK